MLPHQQVFYKTQGLQEGAGVRQGQQNERVSADQVANPHTIRRSFVQHASARTAPLRGEDLPRQEEHVPTRCKQPVRVFSLSSRLSSELQVISPEFSFHLIG